MKKSLEPMVKFKRMVELSDLYSFGGKERVMTKEELEELANLSNDFKSIDSRRFLLDCYDRLSSENEMLKTKTVVCVCCGEGWSLETGARFSFDIRIYDARVKELELQVQEMDKDRLIRLESFQSQVDINRRAHERNQALTALLKDIELAPRVLHPDTLVEKMQNLARQGLKGVTE